MIFRLEEEKTSKGVKLSNILGLQSLILPLSGQINSCHVDCVAVTYIKCATVRGISFYNSNGFLFPESISIPLPVSYILPLYTKSPWASENNNTLRLQ